MWPWLSGTLVTFVIHSLTPFLSITLSLTYFVSPFFHCNFGISFAPPSPPSLILADVLFLLLSITLILADLLSYSSLLIFANFLILLSIDFLRGRCFVPTLHHIMVLLAGLFFPFLSVTSFGWSRVPPLHCSYFGRSSVRALLVCTMRSSWRTRGWRCLSWCRMCSCTSTPSSVGASCWPSEGNWSQLSLQKLSHRFVRG